VRRHRAARHGGPGHQPVVLAHVVLVLTEWAHFREVDPVVLARVVATPAVVDGRNCLDADAWRQAGWTYRAPGRP
jgi:UDPglucose 6-dehydrogenase